MENDLDGAMEALRRATAAGDADSARQLAKVVDQLERETKEAKAEEPTTPLGRAASAVGSAVKGAGQFVADTAGAAVDAARGPEGLPDLPEFDAPPQSLGQFASAGGMLAAVTPEQQRDIILENFPGAEIEEVEADGGQKYYIVDYTDPNTGEQHKGYVNAPGLSTRDVAGVAAQGLAFTPAGRLGKGLGMFARAGRVGAGTAATSAGLDVAAQQAGAEDGIDPWRAVTAGGAGGGLELLSPTAARMWRAMRGGKGQFFDERTGKLTKEGIRQARKAGLANEDIADLDTHAQRTFSQYVEGGMEPEIGARMAQSEAAGIPLSRGQATKEFSQLNTEERMRKGLMGETPKRAMDDLAERQRFGAEQGAGKIQQKLAQGETSGLREAQAGERVLGGARTAADDLKAQIDDAYSNTRNQFFGVSPEAAERLPAIIDDALGDFDITPDLTPAAHRAQKVLGELVETVAEGNGTRFETFRRRLGNLVKSANNKTDRAAATRLRNGFDRWMDDAIDQGMFEGNPQTLEMLKEARALRRKYGQQFEAVGSRDSAGKIMQKIVEEAETPEQVVNYIMGQSALGRNQATHGAVRRIKKAVGADSEAWAAIREMAFLRMTRDKRGNFVGGAAFKKNLDELLNTNKSLADELFDKSEVRMMRRFGEAVELASPPSTNPSGTAFGLENALRYTLRRFGQRQSFTKGDVAGGTLLNFAARMRLPFIGEGTSSAAASRAVKAPKAPRAKAPAFVGAGTAVERQEPAY